MEPITVILLVVWGILNIILFFKIWGATNDIDILKTKFCGIKTQRSRSLLVLVRELYFMGKNDEAEKLITSELLANIEQIATDVSYNVRENERDTEFTKRYSEKLEEYNKYFKAIGKDIPTQLKEITYQKWKHFGKA